MQFGKVVVEDFRNSVTIRVRVQFDSIRYSFMTKSVYEGDRFFSCIAQLVDEVCNCDPGDCMCVTLSSTAEHNEIMYFGITEKTPFSTNFSCYYALSMNGDALCHTANGIDGESSQFISQYMSELRRQFAEHVETGRSAIDFQAVSNSNYYWTTKTDEAAKIHLQNLVAYFHDTAKAIVDAINILQRNNPLPKGPYQANSRIKRPYHAN